MPKPLATSNPGWPCIGLFGPAGSGKTTLMMRFRVPKPEGGYKLTYIIDGDGKLRGPRNALKKEGLDDSYIVFDRIQFDDDDKPVEPYQQFTRLATLLANAKNLRPFPYGVIGISSTTFLKDVFLNEWRRQMGKRPGTLPEKTEWMQYEFLWTHFIMETLRSFPCITMVDGHQEPEKGQMDSILRLAIAIPGKTGTLLPARLTDCWITASEQVTTSTTVSTKYTVNTVANALNKDVNTGLIVPPVFEATQKNVDEIVKQIVGDLPTK